MTSHYTIHSNVVTIKAPSVGAGAVMQRENQLTSPTSGHDVGVSRESSLSLSKNQHLKTRRGRVTSHCHQRAICPESVCGQAATTRSQPQDQDSLSTTTMTASAGTVNSNTSPPKILPVSAYKNRRGRTLTAPVYTGLGTTSPANGGGAT